MSKKTRVKGHMRSTSNGKTKVKSHARSLPESDLSFSKKDMPDDLDSFDAQGLTGWKRTAKKELEDALDVKTDVRTYDYYEDLGAFALEGVSTANNGEREWIVFENMSSAERAAEQKVREDIEEEPGIFQKDFLQRHMYVSDVDKRMIAGEEAEFEMEQFDEQWELDNDYGILLDALSLISEVNENYDLDYQSEIDALDEKLSAWDSDMDAEWEKPDDKQDFSKTDKTYSEIYAEMDSLWDKVRSDAVANKSDEIEKQLEDPIEYFVEERGMYSVDDLMKQSFIRIDEREAAEDAVNIDGVAHFLDVYDGEAVELKSGGVAFGTN